MEKHLVFAASDFAYNKTSIATAYYSQQKTQPNIWLFFLPANYRYAIQIDRDQLNSRFHGRDIFREIRLLPWKMSISMKSVIFRKF